MAQLTGKKRIEILRNIEDKNIQNYIALMDAATDKKTVSRINNDKFDLIPNLRDINEDQYGIDVYWTLCDLKDAKERDLNRIEREAKVAAKQQKENVQKEKKEAHQKLVTHYLNIPILKGILDDLGVQFYDETVEDITKDYTKKIEAYFTDGVFNRERPSSKDYHGYQAYLRIQGIMAPFMTQHNLKRNWKAILNKIATESAKIWVDEFKAKMALKLGAIIDFKGGAEVKRFGNVAEYIIHLSFKDGSYFYIKTQRVWARSCNGVNFVRFPSTFHDVRFADGSNMHIPSAAKMQKEFGVDIRKKED